MVDEKLITAIWILFIIYLSYRYFMNKKKTSNLSSSDDNMKDILTSDKYKVKGQYD